MIKIKKNIKAAVFIATLVFILILFSTPVSNNDSNTIPSESSDSFDSSDSEILRISASWNVSDYINFTGPLIEAEENHKYRIYIDDGEGGHGGDGEYSWDTTVAENEWASGSGTWSDPFVIENLYVNGQGEAGILYIKRVGRPFIIRNCWFNYSGGATPGFAAGLKFFHVNYGNITNNIITYTHNAISFNYLSHWNRISNNIIIGDHTTAGLSRGIEFDYSSHNNTFRNNKLFNLYSAVYIARSDSIIFEGNYLTDTIREKYSLSPIYTGESNYNTIVKNSFAGAYAYANFSIGIGSNSIGNIIANNTVVTNGTPLSVPIVPDISINAPHVQQNGANLVTLTDSSYNTIAHNRIIRGVADTDLDDDPGTDETTDKGISGYNFLMVLGIIGLFSLVMIKRRSNRLK